MVAKMIIDGKKGKYTAIPSQFFCRFYHEKIKQVETRLNPEGSHFFEGINDTLTLPLLIPDKEKKLS